MKKVPIFFIYAENCKECEAAKKAVKEAIEKLENISSELKLFNSESDIAVKIAINNDIDSIPSCVVGPGGKVLQQSEITVENVLNALKNY
jgi:hypothetical protein